MKAFAGFFGVFALMMMGGAEVWGTSPVPDAEISLRLSNALYCDVKGLLEGNIGLIIGILMVFGGIWGMVRGGKILTAVPFIILGSVMTAVPSIIEASFVGLGNLLVRAEIAKAGFSPPTCPVPQSTVSDEKKQEMNVSSSVEGSFYPGKYAKVKTICPPTAGGSVCQ